MDGNDVVFLGPRARPISSERDYQAARRLLSEHAQTLKPFLEAGRFQSLIRELSDYESRSASTHGSLAEHAADYELDRRNQLQRRWSDAGPWAGGQAAYV
jgi:hypothetical protein